MRTGTCTPDAGGVEVTSTTFRVDLGGHEINVRPVGEAKCQGNKCIVTTTATPKSRTWTWVFRSPDTATIRGNFPHWTEKEGDNGIVGFNLTLKKGCPG